MQRVVDRNIVEPRPRHPVLRSQRLVATLARLAAHLPEAHALRTSGCCGLRQRLADATECVDHDRIELRAGTGPEFALGVVL
jgi:hypothetical protein